MKKILLLTSLTFVLFSCSNKELDRGKAFDIIEEFYDYPNVEIVNFQGVTSSQKLNNEYRNLRGQKFITEKRKGKYGNEFWVLMTQKGKAFTLSGEPNYNGYRVASSILKLNEVTGIRFNDGKNTAYVDYTIKRDDVTPFGNSKSYNEGDLIEKQTVMQLYDDGWRITENKKDAVIKIENVKGFDEKYLSNIDQILNKLTLETSNSPCLIKRIYELNGNKLIEVDYITFRVDEDENGIPRKIITNNNPKLRTFILDSNTKVGPEGFVENISDIEKRNCDECIWYINVLNGSVSSLNADTAG